MRVLSSLVVLILASGLPAYAQSPVRLDSTVTIGVIAANGASVTLSSIDVGGIGSAKIQTLDSYSGTWEVQCSLDGTNFDISSELNLVRSDDSTIVTSVTDEVGIWDITNAAACTAIRVQATAGFAATDTTFIISAIQSGGGGGPGGGGGAASSNVNVDEIAGTAAPLITDALGDNHANTQDALAVLNFPMVFDGSTWDRWTGSVSISNFITDGTAFSAGTSVGVATLCRRDDSSLSPGASVADGDFSTFACGAYGQQWVSFLNPATGLPYSLATDATLGTTTFTEATSTGPISGVVRNDTADSLVNTTNEITALGVDGNGLLWSRFLDPCSGINKTTTPISITADTVIVSALASNKTYICAFSVVAAAAEIISITQGDTSTCGTNEVALLGSTTDANGMSLAANGGVVIGNGMSTVIAGTVTNDDICLNVSGSNRVSGFVTWVQAP